MADLGLRDHKLEDKQLHTCGATSSFCPELHKVPLSTIAFIANAYAAGQQLNLAAIYGDTIPEDLCVALAEPGVEQIPPRAIVSLAKRYKLGEVKHGKDNWKKGLTDVDYVVKRLDHVAFHAMKAAAKLRGTLPVDGDDDAGAILWGGAFLVEALVALEEAAPKFRDADSDAGVG